MLKIYSEMIQDLLINKEDHFLNEKKESVILETMIKVKEYYECEKRLY